MYFKYMSIDLKTKPRWHTQARMNFGKSNLTNVNIFSITHITRSNNDQIPHTPTATVRILNLLLPLQTCTLYNRRFLPRQIKVEKFKKTNPSNK